MKRWNQQLKDEAEVQSPALFICRVEMGSSCVTSPRKFLLQICAEMIRMQPSLLPCDLTGDTSKLAETWVGLSRRLVAICGRVVFALCGMDRMIRVPGSWFPADLPRGVKVLIPATIWLPSDITSQPYEELELPSLTPSASKRLIHGLQSGGLCLAPDAEDDILVHPAIGLPLFVVLSCRVAAMLGTDVAHACHSVEDLFVHCVQLTGTQVRRPKLVPAFLSLVALALSVGAPLRYIELEALLEHIGNQDGSADRLLAERPDTILRVAELEHTPLGCFTALQSDGGVVLYHDVIVAHILTLYDLLPASPSDEIAGAGSRSKATELHELIGDAFYSQMRSAVSEYTSSNDPSSQAEHKLQIVRAAEIAAVHRCALHHN